MSAPTTHPVDAGPPSTASLAIHDEPLVDRLLTPAELDARRRLRVVIEREVAPRAEELDRTSEFAGPGAVALCQAGFGGLIFPERYGGAGASTVAYALTIEAVASACPATSLVLMTQMHAGYPILIAGSDEQRSTFLPALCEGSVLGALAITEPSAGSDVSGIRTVAHRDGDDYVLNGSKTFITSGDRAGVIICFATVDRARGREGVTAFLVPGDTPGLSSGNVLEKLGMHGSSTAELFFDDVRVPAENRLGEEGGAWQLSMRTVVKSRISAASQGLGIATTAYGLALDWADRRELLSSDGWQPQLFRLAELRTRILAARLLLYGVARAADEEPDRDLTAEVGMAKFTCTDLGMEACELVTGILGAEGDLCDQRAERLLRDVKVTQIYDGTNEIQRLLVARDVRRRLSAASP